MTRRPTYRSVSVAIQRIPLIFRMLPLHPYMPKRYLHPRKRIRRPCHDRISFQRHYPLDRHHFRVLRGPRANLECQQTVTPNPLERLFPLSFPSSAPRPGRNPPESNNHPPLQSPRGIEHVHKDRLLPRRAVIVRVQKRVHGLSGHPHDLPHVVVQEDEHRVPGQQGADLEQGRSERGPLECGEEA